MSAHLADLDLRGRRVRLVRPRVEDAEAAYELLAGRRAILDWIEWAGPKDVEELRERARHWCIASEEGADYLFGILCADTGRLAGGASLRSAGHPERGDLGYWIGLPFQGRGFATEAVALALWLAFEALQARTVSACVFEGNHASRRVLEKHGFALVTPAAPGAPGSSCGARPRWTFERARGPVQRPAGFELAFAAPRP